MKNISVLLYILNLIIAVIFPGEVYSQKDTTYRHSFRIGFEASYPARIIFEPEIKQYEASMDFEFRKNWFATFEAGILQVDIQRENFNYYSDGWFFRTGLDFNILGRETIKDNDIVYFGIRYGYAKQAQVAENILVFDKYWGEFIPPDEKSDINVHWGDIVGGVKTALFANIFLGWSLRLRIIVSETDDALMKPYRIAGFGKQNDNITLDFNYSIFYRIPY